MLVSLFISLDASTVVQIRTPAAWSFRIFIFLSDYPLRLRRKIVPPPILAQSKFFFLQNLNILT